MAFKMSAALVNGIVVLFLFCRIYGTVADLEADVNLMQTTLDLLTSKTEEYIRSLTTKQHVLEASIQRQDSLLQHQTSLINKLTTENAELRARQTLSQSRVDVITTLLTQVQTEQRKHSKKLSWLKQQVGGKVVCTELKCDTVSELRKDLRTVKSETDKLAADLKSISELSMLNKNDIANQNSSIALAQSKVVTVEIKQTTMEVKQQNLALTQQLMKQRLNHSIEDVKQCFEKLTNGNLEREVMTKQLTTQRQRIESLEKHPRRTSKQYVWKKRDIFSKGIIKKVTFNKRNFTSHIQVMYSTNVNVEQFSCARWWIEFNGHECYNPQPIDAVVNIGNTDVYQPITLMGMCSAIVAGQLEITVKVGACPGYRLAKADTGFASTSRIIVEEIFT